MQLIIGKMLYYNISHRSASEVAMNNGLHAAHLSNKDEDPDNRSKNVLIASLIIIVIIIVGAVVLSL